jgi:hypothetical protein
MRQSFGADWAFGVRGGIENIVRSVFPNELRLWPLLTTFDFESFLVDPSHAVIILRDKLSGIPSGFDPRPFPFSDTPPIPKSPIDAEKWQSYLFAKFSLRPEDAAFVIPVHDSGKSDASEDYKLFSSLEKSLWDLQMRITIARQKAMTQPTPSSSPQAPVHITYNVSGTNTRVNINSNDSSINVVQEQTPEIFSNLLTAIKSANLDSEHLRILEDSVLGMAQSFGQPSFSTKYQNFMSVLSDHIQVFGPIVAAYLPKLAQLVT